MNGHRLQHAHRPEDLRAAAAVAQAVFQLGFHVAQDQSPLVVFGPGQSLLHLSTKRKNQSKKKLVV